MDYQALLQYFEDRQPEMLQVIELVVSQETPSSDKVRLDAFADFLAGRLESAGATTEVIPNADRGNHVRATYNPANTSTASDAKPGLVLCHFDTVWPVGSLATHPFRIEDGKAYGPGIFDMQTSLVLAEYVLHAVAALALTLPRPLTILMTSDEEVGSGTSRDLISEEALRSEYVLVMESPLPGGVLKTARKGGGHFEIEVIGKAAHAGVEPERGISAVHELAHQILAIQALNDPEQGTTMNVDVISGGTATNVIPAHARGVVDMRAWTQEEADRVTEAFNALKPVLPGAELVLHSSPNRPPLERKMTVDLFHRTQSIGQKLGLTLEEGRTGGGSDGNLTGALGVPTLDGLGVPGHGAHADHEHIEVDKIATSAALLVALLMEL